MTEEQRKEYKSIYWELDEVLDMLQTTINRIILHNKFFDRITHDEVAMCHRNLNKTVSKVRTLILTAEDNSKNE